MPDTFLLICGGIMLFGIASGTRCFGLIPPTSLGERILLHYMGARERGLTTAQATDELRMREALVRVRNRASETTMRSPHVGRDAIRWATEAEAERLDARCRYRFIAWVNSLPESDVLTKQASDLSTRVAVAKAISVAKWSTVDSSDTDAALTVRR